MTDEVSEALVAKKSSFCLTSDQWQPMPIEALESKKQLNTRANQAEKAIRMVKKTFDDRLRAQKHKTWVETMDVSVKRCNSQVESTIRVTPNKANGVDKAVQVRANTILKEKPRPWVSMN